MGGTMVSINNTEVATSNLVAKLFFMSVGKTNERTSK